MGGNPRPATASTISPGSDVMVFSRTYSVAKIDTLLRSSRLSRPLTILIATSYTLTALGNISSCHWPVLSARHEEGVSESVIHHRNEGYREVGSRFILVRSRALTIGQRTAHRNSPTSSYALTRGPVSNRTIRNESRYRGGCPNKHCLVSIKRLLDQWR